MDKLAKYQIIQEEIKKQIQSGAYLVGEKIPAESQLMTIFSVSRHTVRQAISSLVNEGVLEKIQGSGTFVVEQRKAQAQSGNKSKTIGVITTYLSDYIFPSIIRGIEEELRENGYSLLLASTQNDTDNERDSIEMMLRHQVDGLIIEPTRSSFFNPNLSYYLQLKLNQMPFVYLHTAYPEMDAPVVAMNDEAGTELATEHLLGLNHRDIAIVSKVDDIQGRNRLKGYFNAFEKAGISVSSGHVLTYETHTSAGLRGEIVKLLSADNRPTAFVAYNDQVALMIEEAANECGLLIPEDLSLVSHDASGMRLNRNGKALTSIVHPQDQMGKDAARVLLKAIEQPGNKCESVIYEPRLIIQETTKKLGQ
ncbi:GntR family transcriptional regulator [Jeotgalibaca porci]|uniref:GntR family transcriptional regulator n=1 Tax=Jeotgalibaca porci TaxID=1868793 RepID=UPI0035A09679